MNRTLVMLVLTVVAGLAAPAVWAQNYISLAWGDCLVDGGTSRANVNCSAESWTEYLIFTHQLGVDQPNFVGIEGIIDMDDQTNPASMSGWWQWDIGSAGTCRTAAVVSNVPEASMSPRWTGATCIDVGMSVKTLATTYIMVRRPSPGTGTGPNSQRIVFQWVVPYDQPIPYTAGTNVAVGSLRICSRPTNGHATCAGCTAGITFTLNSIFAAQPAGSPNGSLTATDPLPFPGWPTYLTNCVSANYPATTCLPFISPTETRTWGQLRALYR
jgi:hypothetical protein